MARDRCMDASNTTSKEAEATEFLTQRQVWQPGQRHLKYYVICIYVYTWELQEYNEMSVVTLMHSILLLNTPTFLGSAQPKNYVVSFSFNYTTFSNTWPIILDSKENTQNFIHKVYTSIKNMAKNLNNENRENIQIYN